jgi:hypothetical protein
MPAKKPMKKDMPTKDMKKKKDGKDMKKSKKDCM